MNTMQQEFDAVVAHLYTQRKPASDVGNKLNIKNPGCWYRQPGTGLSCAVGCRIPDDVYTADMDDALDDTGTSVGTLVKRFGNILPPEISAYSEMFAHLQMEHDSAPVVADGTFNFEKLSVRLAKAADRFGLTFNEPQQ